ncbi:hypothetical protein CONCODRAFT_78892 [Conidiobolus coronatus NRRL 28638]|uniref:Transmembrane protein 198 n=1 Tax=Conidiobolus coronatus (strain ATCC 28846 / CBS 209.66 / NRRL 28638) TaxID=796925 RepID=A0A137P5P5_CONC2|nr:hypothetical protein CONCODRAFT_78892 [Conidiobolus coronatus NRRL 28638]|eukprot:KXN70338.1 hypothetical protein CONCODRAFT_78892 [Conidiobolus coronatus NRRL 28638]
MGSKVIALIASLLFLTSSVNAELSSFAEKSMRLNPEAIASSVILMVIGIIFIFFGKRLIKFLGFIAGFLFFGAIALLIASRLVDFNNWGFPNVIASSEVRGVLSYCVLRLGVMFLGFLTGYSIGGIILQSTQSLGFWAQLGIMIGFGAVGAILALFFIDWTILITTSYIGAQTLLVGVDVIVNKNYIDFVKANTNLIYIKCTPLLGGMVGCAFLLTIVGAVFQYKVFTKPNYYEVEKQGEVNNSNV